MRTGNLETPSAEGDNAFRQAARSIAHLLNEAGA
jgi:hypothetical protein